MRQYDNQLKQLFCWYATLEEAEPLRITWDFVRQNSCTISSGQFLLMLLNFQVCTKALYCMHVHMQTFIAAAARVLKLVVLRVDMADAEETSSEEQRPGLT